jgi:hypothetical protein
VARGRRRQSTVNIHNNGDGRDPYRSAEGGVAEKSNKGAECINTIRPAGQDLRTFSLLKK